MMEVDNEQQPIHCKICITDTIQCLVLLRQSQSGERMQMDAGKQKYEQRTTAQAYCENLDLQSHLHLPMV